jgi:membrane protein involved in colicin uptake
MSTNDAALAVKPLESKLTEFAAYVSSIQVRNGQEYAEVCQQIVSARTEIKKIGFVLDPGISSAQEHLNLLRNQKKGFVDRWQQQITIGEEKAESWKREERRKAEEEQRRIREEQRIAAEKQAATERAEREKQAAEERKRREAEIAAAQKAGELRKREAERLAKEAREAEERERKRAAEDAAKRQAEAAAEAAKIKVEPSIPKVAGIKARVNWKFRIVDASKLRRTYLQADEVKIGAMVRNIKDKAKAEAECPGIEVYTEDSI